MIAARKPANGSERLAAPRWYELLDTESDPMPAALRADVPPRALP